MIILFFLALILIFVIFLIIWRYLFFYRNPDREIQYDQKSILSPADGFIVYCKRINPKENIFSIKKNKHIKLDDLMNINDNSLKNKPGWLIGIFMTFFDVHYNFIDKQNIKGRKQTPAEAAGFKFELGSMFRLLKLINYA